MSNKELKALQGMKQLLSFPGYLRLITELELRIKDLDKEIIETLWDNEVKYTALDLKRAERIILQQFIELPHNLIETFDNIFDVEEEKDIIDNGLV